MRPVPWDRDLYARAETVRQEVQEHARARDALHTAGAGADDGVTLILHGDLTPESVPQLQSVLDALVLLQPDRLVVDLSEVGRVSSRALRMIERCGAEIGDLVLRSPSPSACSALERLGRSDLIARSSTDHLGPWTTSVHATPESLSGAFPETVPVFEDAITSAASLGG